MKGKGVKLIIGIIFLIVAVVLYLLNVLNSWLCLALAIIGLILIVLSFGEKEGQPSGSTQPDLPVQHEAPKVEEDAFMKEEPMEEVEVGASSNSDDEELL
jgi:hypothetical protein